MSMCLPDATMGNFSQARVAFVDASQKPTIPTRYIGLKIDGKETVFVKPKQPLDLSDFTGIYTEFDAERNQKVLEARYYQGKVKERIVFNPTLGYPGESYRYDDHERLHGAITRYNPLLEYYVISQTFYEHGERGETKFYPQWPKRHDVDYKKLHYAEYKQCL